VVDVPNACANIVAAEEIFDFDIMPSSAGPIKHIKGDIQIRCHRTSSSARRDAGGGVKPPASAVAKF